MFTLILLASVAGQPPAQTHEARNPLYKSLLEAGLPVGSEAKAKFPPPTMPDGLDAAKQTATIKELLAQDYDYAEFTRKSVFAPQLLKLRDVKPSDPKAPARGVDVWFVAYGDLKAPRRRQVPRPTCECRQRRWQGKGTHEGRSGEAEDHRGRREDRELWTH